jgi:hypothetical protein
LTVFLGAFGTLAIAFAAVLLVPLWPLVCLYWLFPDHFFVGLAIVVGLAFAVKVMVDMAVSVINWWTRRRALRAH